MRFADLKLRARLGAAFGLQLVLMLVLTAGGFWLVGDFGASTDYMLNDAMAKERLVNEWHAATELNGTRAQLLVNLTNDRDRSALEARLQATSARIDQIKAELDKMVNSASGKTMLAEANGKRGAYTDARNAVAAALRSGNPDRAAGDRMLAALDDYLASIDKLAKHQAQKSTALAQELKQQSSLAQRVMLLMFLIASTAAIASAILVTRSVTRPLQRAMAVAQAVAQGRLSRHEERGSRDETGQLLDALNQMNRDLYRIVDEVRDGSAAIASASQQIANGNLDLSARTEQQASALEETATAMEELTATVKQNAENARQANQLADAASNVARHGGMVVTQVVATMGSINASAGRITDIIGVIDGIAFQTNILALNAAVEAACAGEHGRGFAVVASEVRNLAQRSASAAREIKALIGAAVSDVDAGTALVSRAGETMDEIVASVERVTAIMRDIALASREQETGIEQINGAISQMDVATQQNAALVEEASAASAAMRDQAGHMDTVVGIFQLEGVARRDDTPRLT